MRLQAFPTPHAASQASSITQAPVPGLQYCPEGQATPLHGSRKQPVTQAPETQVWPSEQLFPAQGSVTATQVARHVVPVAQLEAAARQGSGWQVPPRQTCPPGHCAGQVEVPLAAPAAPPVPPRAPPSCDPDPSFPFALPLPTAPAPPESIKAVPPSSEADVEDAAGWKSQPAIDNARSDSPNETISDERRERAVPIGSASATAHCEVRK